MLIYDIHSHLGKTSSGDENTPQELVNDLAAYGISRVGISSLSGISMRDQNDLVHRAMEAYPGVIKGYGFINPKAGDAIDEVNRCLGDYHMDGIKFHSSTPYTWVEYAKMFPKIDFLFTHIGYYEFGMSTIEAVRNVKNVWVETSGQMDVEVLQKAIDVLGPERVCFGTDWPYKPVNIEVEKFYEMKVPEDKLEYIFHKNAAYLWRMEEEK